MTTPTASRLVSPEGRDCSPRTRHVLLLGGFGGQEGTGTVEIDIQPIGNTSPWNTEPRFR